MLLSLDELCSSVLVLPWFVSIFALSSRAKIYFMEQKNRKPEATSAQHLRSPKHVSGRLQPFDETVAIPITQRSTIMFDIQLSIVIE